MIGHAKISFHATHKNATVCEQINTEQRIINEQLTKKRDEAIVPSIAGSYNTLLNL